MGRSRWSGSQDSRGVPPQAAGPRGTRDPPRQRRGPCLTNSGGWRRDRSHSTGAGIWVSKSCAVAGVRAALCRATRGQQRQGDRPDRGKERPCKGESVAACSHLGISSWRSLCHRPGSESDTCGAFGRQPVFHPQSGQPARDIGQSAGRAARAAAGAALSSRPAGLRNGGRLLGGDRVRMGLCLRLPPRIQSTQQIPEDQGYRQRHSQPQEKQSDDNQWFQQFVHDRHDSVGPAGAFGRPSLPDKLTLSQHCKGVYWVLYPFGQRGGRWAITRPERTCLGFLKTADDGSTMARRQWRRGEGGSFSVSWRALPRVVVRGSGQSGRIDGVEFESQPMLISPFLMAYLTRATRLWRSSFRMMFSRCRSTVLTLIVRVSAISRFVWPSAIRVNTWRSRGVSLLPAGTGSLAIAAENP